MNPITHFLLVIFLFGFCQIASSQLTGEWKDDNGTCYNIRQLDNRIYWSMDGSPRVLNVFHGYKADNIIAGMWIDVPGGDKRSNGTLSLRVESNDRMVKIGQSGNYGASIWTRQPCSATGPLVGNWKWDANCGNAGMANAEWKITSQDANGNFKGQMKDKSGPHIGSLEGTMQGNWIRMVRTIRSGHQQIWSGTFNPATKTFTGTLTDPYHQDCTFTSNKM